MERLTLYETDDAKDYYRGDLSECCIAGKERLGKGGGPFMGKFGACLSSENL